MSNSILLLLACIVAGFALLRVPLAGTFLASAEPIFSFIGLLAIVVFSLCLILKGLMYLLRI
ncbi:hypothetical protein JCM9140_3328 [Halalkalibacter wakoensis JCM 9140]|uniref:Uncharacterized protein n=1 Tax=Halalkalibacter wakoensis JCM 9140 TaxID=1236970 RepID=W4Q530_9BACI|nr:hypothetical protein [Halalkalibacter wakoensis]GAE27201.1 hypothetical protein JCM9140_3328 [Halalkalibacter wakoensis JCM 9140]